VLMMLEWYKVLSGLLNTTFNSGLSIYKLVKARVQSVLLIFVVWFRIVWVVTCTVKACMCESAYSVMPVLGERYLAGADSSSI